MAARRRTITLLLLLCGLCTAPLGSLEQVPADASTSVSVPHASAFHALGFSATRHRGHGGSGGGIHGGAPAVLPGHPHECFFGALVPQTGSGPCTLAAERPPILTYRANAPPLDV